MSTPITDGFTTGRVVMARWQGSTYIAPCGSDDRIYREDAIHWPAPHESLYLRGIGVEVFEPEPIWVPVDKSERSEPFQDGTWVRYDSDYAVERITAAVNGSTIYHGAGPWILYDFANGTISWRNAVNNVEYLLLPPGWENRETRDGDGNEVTAFARKTDEVTPNTSEGQWEAVDRDEPRLTIGESIRFTATGYNTGEHVGVVAYSGGSLGVAPCEDCGVSIWVADGGSGQDGQRMRTFITDVEREKMSTEGFWRPFGEISDLKDGDTVRYLVNGEEKISAPLHPDSDGDLYDECNRHWIKLGEEPRHGLEVTGVAPGSWERVIDTSRLDEGDVIVYTHDGQRHLSAPLVTYDGMRLIDPGSGITVRVEGSGSVVSAVSRQVTGDFWSAVDDPASLNVGDVVMYDADNETLTSGPLEVGYSDAESLRDPNGSRWYLRSGRNQWAPLISNVKRLTNTEATTEQTEATPETQGEIERLRAELEALQATRMQERTQFSEWRDRLGRIAVRTADANSYGEAVREFIENHPDLSYEETSISGQIIITVDFTARPTDADFWSADYNDYVHRSIRDGSGGSDVDITLDEDVEFEVSYEVRDVAENS